jgi:hypothetical protein
MSFNAADGDEDGGNGNVDALFTASTDESKLSGYLYKMTRDGRWQRRWFETNGIFLTYYKSRSREKLLAALSLLQVGEIKQLPPSDDPERKEGLFTIQLNSRVYTLRGKSEEEAAEWVKTLLQIKESNADNSSTVSPLRGDSMRGALQTSNDGASASHFEKSGRSCFLC